MAFVLYGAFYLFVAMSGDISNDSCLEGEVHKYCYHYSALTERQKSMPADGQLQLV